MVTVERPSPVTGFRLAWRLRKLVAAVALVVMASVVPLGVLVEVSAGGTLTDLPDGPLPDGELELILLEVLGPIAAPLLVLASLMVLVLFAWSVAWHGGAVRWWSGAGAARVRLSEILSHGVALWWRYARLWITGLVTTAGFVALIWFGLIQVEGGISNARVLYAALIGAAALSMVVLCFGWVATLRAAWILGLPGRSSAAGAWLLGAGITLRHPLTSTIPFLVWSLPAVLVLVASAFVGWPYGLPAMALAVLGASWCWVALFLSYAPQEPPDEWVQKMQARAAARAARPRKK
jgi:hypothetical protein